MKFSELIDVNSICAQKAFLLGMIYAWPIFTSDYKNILAYSAYRLGTRSKGEIKYTLDQYFEMHVTKLKNFLGDAPVVKLNSELSNSLEFTCRLQKGVSVIIEFDRDIPSSLNSEIYLYGLIEKWLIDADEKFKNIFLVGVMDARGSLDFTGKYLSIDIARKDEPEITKRKLNKYNDIIGTVFNYNPRLVQESSSRKNDQFRLNLKYYIGRFGLFTPYKIDYYKSEYADFIEKIKYDYFFLDKKYENVSLETSSIDRNYKINDLAIKLSREDITDEEKKKIVEKYKEENLIDDTEDELLYSSQNIKESTKKDSKYLCEFDNDHLTFNAKSNNRNYVEAHHFIPFSERNKFAVSIDISENIICLCPNCHRKIHLAVDSERKDFIESLFVKRKDSLEKAGIKFELSNLLSFYRVQ